MGIREKKVLSTLKEFCSQRFEPWAKARFETACRKNWTWYRTGIRALTIYKPLANVPLDLAVEWGVLGTAPKVKVLSGERRRERVISPDEEAPYLAAAPEPLASIASVLADTGMRPEGCFRLRWESTMWLMDAMARFS